MRVWDSEKSIFHGLDALAWRRYLCAMWILCAELRNLYEERLTGPEQSLMAETLKLVREVVVSGDTASEAARAGKLAASWERLIAERENDVLPGQWNAWVTFANLAAEIAGSARHYIATERLTKAATELWREPYPGRARRLDPDEEVDDASPMAQTLGRFERVVAGVAKAPGPRWDPAELRVQILGG